MPEQSTQQTRLLPQTYYLDHFLFVLEGIKAYHSSLLTADELEYLHLVKNLPGDALKLYARLTNRVTRFFRVDKLKYSEINLPKAISDLTASGLVYPATPKSSGDILECFSMAEVRKLISGKLAVPSLWCRAEVDRTIINWTDHQSWMADVLKLHPVIELAANGTSLDSCTLLN